MKFEEWLSQQGGLIEVDCGCVTTEAFYHWLRAAYESGALTNEGTIQSGNSAQPVTVPAGYVLVPVDLLSDLRDFAHPEIEKYCEMWEGRRDEEFPAMRKIISDADSLLAAAPTAPDDWIPVSEQIPDEVINAAYERHLYGIMSGTGNKRSAVDFLNECLASMRIKP